MKTLVSLIALGCMLLMADVASASGYGAAVVQQNIVIRQRQRIQPLRSFRNRQRIVVRQQVVAPYVAPVYAAPIVQSYVVPQQVIVPQVQSYIAVPQVQSYVAPLQGGCSAAVVGGCNVF